MDVLRHTGRAQLSSFIGGSPSTAPWTAAQWRFAPYTEADLQKQIDDAGKVYGKAGVKLVQDVKDYVAGINAYIAAAKKNPNLMPAEYAALGKLPQPWKATDVVAEASLIGGIFGKGGGRELDSAQLMQAFEKRFGRKAGRARLAQLPLQERPRGADHASPQRFPYETDERLRQARPGAARPRLGAPGARRAAGAGRLRARERPGRVRERGRRAHAGAEHAARVELGARLRPRVEDRAIRSASSALRSATTSRRS